MNRPDFSTAIGDSDQVFSLFDEIMALYNIVSDCYTEVTLSNKTDTAASFEVIFKDKEKANHICDIINGQKIVIYETSLQISSEKTNNTTVIITMIRI